MGLSAKGMVLGKEGMTRSLVEMAPASEEMAPASEGADSSDRSAVEVPLGATAGRRGPPALGKTPSRTPDSGPRWPAGHSRRSGIGPGVGGGGELPSDGSCQYPTRVGAARESPLLSIQARSPASAPSSRLSGWDPGARPETTQGRGSIRLGATGARHGRGSAGFRVPTAPARFLWNGTVAHRQTQRLRPASGVDSAPCLIDPTCTRILTCRTKGQPKSAKACRRLSARPRTALLGWRGTTARPRTSPAPRAPPPPGTEAGRAVRQAQRGWGEGISRQ